MLLRPLLAAPPRPLRLAAIGLALCLLLPLWWLIPGLWLGWFLAEQRGGSAGREPVDADARLLGALPLAFASPALALPLARVLHLPWKEAWLALALAGAIAGLRRLSRRPAPAAPRPPLPLLTLAAAALGAVCWWPLRELAAPAGVDMAMHLTFARLLWLQTTVPLTQDPVWAGVPLGAYPLGFHGGVALTAVAAGDVLRAGLLVTAATHALVPVATYVCVRRRARDWPAAGAALLVAWIARNPQAYVGWGGNPCVLGTAFALVALRLLLAPPPERAPERVAIEAGLLAAATALTHPTPAALLPYVFVLALPALASLRVARPDGAWLRHLAMAGVIAVAALLPQAPLARATDFSAAEVAWVRDHHRAPPQAPEPGAAGAFRYVKGQYDDAMAVLFAASLLAAAALRRRPGPELACAAGLAALVALAYGAAAWRLPPAPALYPERLMLFALPLLAIALRRALAATLGEDPAGRLRRGVTVALAIGLAGLATAKHAQFYSRKARDGCFVTAADRLAFAWLDRHAPPGVLVDTNYGDAGAYLPAAVGLPVTRPQTNPVWFDEMRAATAEREPALRYRGARIWVDGDSTGARIGPADIVFTARAAGLAAIVAATPSGRAP